VGGKVWDWNITARSIRKIRSTVGGGGTIEEEVPKTHDRISGDRDTLQGGKTPQRGGKKRKRGGLPGRAQR